MGKWFPEENEKSFSYIRFKESSRRTITLTFIKWQSLQCKAEKLNFVRVRFAVQLLHLQNFWRGYDTTSLFRCLKRQSMQCKAVKSSFVRVYYAVQLLHLQNFGGVMIPHPSSTASKDNPCNGEQKNQAL